MLSFSATVRWLAWHRTEIVEETLGLELGGGTTQLQSQFSNKAEQLYYDPHLKGIRIAAKLNPVTRKLRDKFWALDLKAAKASKILAVVTGNKNKKHKTQKAHACRKDQS